MMRESFDTVCGTGLRCSRWIWIAALAGCASLPGAPAGEAPRTAQWLEVEGTRFRPYGFPRLDAIFTDSRLVPNNQFPFWAASEDRSVQPSDNDEELDIHPRLTRLGIEIERDSIPRLGGARLKGKVEIDFQNGGSESREAVRMRHAYLEIESDSGLSLLAGQTWDVISPLYPSVNDDGMMWNAGNLGDRRPQIRLAWRAPLAAGSLFQLTGALARRGAINNRDLDGDGTPDGIDSGRPLLEARAGVSGLLDGRLSGGVWGHYGWEETGLDVAGRDRFTSSGLGADLLVRLSGALRLAGEVWSGTNLDDVRGGIGQGINASTGDEIASHGGWAELRCEAAPWYTPAIGVTLDDPDNADLDPLSAAGGGPRERNRAIYLSNRFDLGGGLRAGLEYIHWDTEYAGDLAGGDANRIDLWMMLRF